MRGSAKEFYDILRSNNLLKEEPSTNSQIADLLCMLEERLQQGYIPKDFERILDLAIDYIRG